VLGYTAKRSNSQQRGFMYGNQQLFNQQQISLEALGVLPLSDAINNVVGTASTVLVRPSGAKAIVLMADVGDFRVKLGDNTVKTISAVSGNNLTVTGHGLFNGQGPIQLATTGSLPSGLAASTDYWVIYIDANTIQLATSQANTVNSTGMAVPTGSGAPVPITLSSAGTGTNTIVDGMPATESPATTTTDGSGGVLVSQGASPVFSAPSSLTVKGYTSGSVLSYYWI
jgi:hypothetical protein